MITAYEAYKIFTAVKTHFNSEKYDFLKYNGKTRCQTEAQFLGRKDKALYYHMGKKYGKHELVNALVANMIVNPKLWVGNMTNEECRDRYLEWKSKTSAITRHVVEELNSILDWCDEEGISFNDLFAVKENDHPMIFKMLYKDLLSLESFVIMDSLLNFTAKFDEQMKGDFLWKEWRLRCLKYRPFLNFNQHKMKLEIRKCINTHTLTS